MKRKSIVSLILIATMMISISGCGSKEKTIVLIQDVKQEALKKEGWIKNLIDEATDLLSNQKYDEAKYTFERAILVDKTNKGAYIQIKNIYMEKERLDDAYYFIKLAVDNNIDTDNMKTLLDEIKSKFQVTKLDVNEYLNVEYKLPTRVKVQINNDDKVVDVVWDSNADTSKLGDTKYEGKVEQYDRSVELNLKVVKAPENEGTTGEFTYSKAKEYALKAYNSSDTDFKAYNGIEDENGRKYYILILLSKSLMLQGQSGSMCFIKVYEDGEQERCHFDYKKIRVEG